MGSLIVVPKIHTRFICEPDALVKALLSIFSRRVVILPDAFIQNNVHFVYISYCTRIRPRYLLALRKFVFCELQ
jgi:hypothetical protein